MFVRKIKVELQDKIIFVARQRHFIDNAACDSKQTPSFM